MSKAAAALALVAVVLMVLAWGASWADGQPSGPVRCNAPAVSPSAPGPGQLAGSWFCGPSVAPHGSTAPVVLAGAAVALAMAAVAAGRVTGARSRR